MSWVSTQHYYRLINEQVNAALGRQHSAEILLASVDFQRIVDAQVKGDWTLLGNLLADRAQSLERAGASAFIIASNTMHLVLERILDAVDMPALNIFDATAAAIAARGMTRVGLLGTRYTMNHAFYRDEYAKRGVHVVIPNAADAKGVNEIIFRELIHDVVKPASLIFYQQVVDRLTGSGAEGVILGCTEIGILLKPAASIVPLFDTTTLHARAGSSWLVQV